MDSRNGKLGSGFRGRFNVTLDMPGERMFMVPDRRITEPFEWNMTGVRFDLDSLGTLAATEVLPGSPGALAGIAPGDLLVATDGAIAQQGIDARRLRPNIIVGGVEGLAERTWPGRCLCIGDVVIEHA